MLKRRISTHFVIIFLFVLSGVQVLAQDTSNRKSKKMDFIKIDSIGMESDTTYVFPGFNDKGKEMQKAVKQRNLVDDTLNKIKTGDDFWYAKPIKKELQASKFNFLKWLTKSLSGTAARFVIWCILIGAMVFFFVFYLVNNEIGIFAPAKRKMLIRKNEEELSDNIFEIDFENEITVSLASGNYRLSIRLLFLRLLKAMNERKMIDYSIEKTNFDYLFQLNGTDYFNSFSTLIKNYEYTWYGEFTISEQQYSQIEKNFSQFQQQINQVY